MEPMMAAPITAPLRDSQQDGTGSLAERAYRRLRAEILHGELMPGERLRAADLHLRFGLGLTPIREALGRLAAENLVDLESHRGSRVREASVAELADLMATRRAIERLCLEAAIAHGDTAWEAEIVAALHLLSRTALPQGEQDRAAATVWEARHRRFHAALVAACGSAWLLRFWNLLSDHSERYRKIRLLRHAEAAAEVRDIPGEHQAIAQAVLARDAARATALMDAHLLATEKTVARLLAAEAV
jgi:GntR family transcriptional regulator, carbon starvation induced regulator